MNKWVTWFIFPFSFLNKYLIRKYIFNSFIMIAQQKGLEGVVTISFSGMQNLERQRGEDGVCKTSLLK